ncbi:MAG: MFS transporter [Rikenellaceae bacterium]
MLKFKEKLAYGFGDFASSMFWKIFGMYLLFFYTVVFDISPAIVGTMLLVTRIWDSVNDPIMGIVADRTSTRWGKYRPYLLWGAIPFAIIGTLTFFVPDFSQGGKIAYAYITYTLMMMVYTFVNVPYASLLGVMTPNVKTRNTLASYRMFMAYVGSFVTFMIFQPLIDGIDGALTGTAPTGEISQNPTAWTLATMVIGITSAVFFFLCFKWTKERVKPINDQNGTIKEDLKALAKNWPWWVLLVAGIAALLFNSIRDGVTLFYFADFVKDGYKVPMVGWSLGTLYLIIGQFCNMIGVAFAAPISNKIGKKNLYIIAMVIAAVLSIIFYGFEADQYYMIFIFQALISMCAGIIFPLLWSMYADIVDYQEKLTGRRMTGLIFSSSSMSQKMGWALGGALTGWLLSIYGYDAGLAQQSEHTLSGIKLMMSIIPAACCALAVVAMIIYPLSDKKISK